MSNKYTIIDFKKEIESFYNSFTEFKVFSDSQNELPSNCVVTKSVEVLVNKFGFYNPPCDDEVKEICEKYPSVNDEDKYNLFSSFQTYYHECVMWVS